jgi:hypothetical protein
MEDAAVRNTAEERRFVVCGVGEYVFPSHNDELDPLKRVAVSFAREEKCPDASSHQRGTLLWVPCNGNV